MVQTKLLLILPLVVAVSSCTAGQGNRGYSYYGTSNVRDQRPQPIYGQQPLHAHALAAPSYDPFLRPWPQYTPEYRPLLPSRPSRPALPAIAPPQPSSIGEPQPFVEVDTPEAPTLPEYAVEQPEHAPMYIPASQSGESVEFEPLPEPGIRSINAPQSSTLMAFPPLLPKRQPVREPAIGRHRQSSVPSMTNHLTVTYPTQTPTYSTPPRTVATQAPLVVVTAQSHPAVTQAAGQLKLDFQCKEGDGYYSVEHECDTYIECKQNIAMKYTCPNGLHFNPAAKLSDYPCAYPSEVKCMPGTQEQNPKLTAKCPNQYGYYSMNDSDCSQFIMCQKGLATIMDCPIGLVFNPQISSCDWPANVPQCNPNVFKDFTCPAPLKDEDGQVSDVIYKYRYKRQCKMYIACQHGHPRLLSCDHGLYFDAASQTCINEDYVTDCSVP